MNKNMEFAFGDCVGLMKVCKVLCTTPCIYLNARITDAEFRVYDV